MDLTKKLIELLSDYIEENKKLKENFNNQRTNQTLYEQLISYLKEDPIASKMFITILLNTIYGNNIYVDEYLNIIIQPNNENTLRKFIEKMEQEYNELKIQNIRLNQRINRNSEMLSSAYRTRKSLSLQTEILDSRNDIYNVKRIIGYYEISGMISNKEEILLINEIELHNRKVASQNSSKQEQDYTEKLYSELPNILTIGFQEHDEIEVSKDRKKILDKFTKEIINSIEFIEKEQIIELIESYLRYNLDNNEFNYILVNILNNYIEELITLYSLLLEKDTYIKRPKRIEVVKEYYNVLEKYIIVNNYYNQINEYKIIEDSETEVEEEFNSEYQNEKKLIYSRSDVNIEKAKIIADMADISYEYYENIYDLITKFKKGTLGRKRIKTIQKGNKSSGHIELKDDSIRIILKRINDNMYNVLGVFIKKANNDMGTYKKITDRITPKVDTEEKLKIQLELSEHTENELEKLVKEKGRKNGRK